MAALMIGFASRKPVVWMMTAARMTPPEPSA